MGGLVALAWLVCTCLLCGGGGGGGRFRSLVIDWCAYGSGLYTCYYDEWGSASRHGSSMHGHHAQSPSRVHGASERQFRWILIQRL